MPDLSLITDTLKEFVSSKADTGTKDIDALRLLAAYAMALIPIAIMLYFRIHFIKRLIGSVLRMTIQLVFVGIYLKFIFELNNPALNFAWIFVMIIIANISILGNAGLKKRFLFLPVLAAVLISSALIISYFTFFIIEPKPFYDARYLIPISGMVLGNCLRSNIIALERFYNGIRQNEEEYIAYLLMGATCFEAVKPYYKKALSAALMPMISAVATMGLVSLPGMMTGQILGGSVPTTAVKYQIAIMLTIFTSMSLSTFLSILFTLKSSFNGYSMLNHSIFKEGKGS